MHRSAASATRSLYLCTWCHDGRGARRGCSVHTCCMLPSAAASTQVYNSAPRAAPRRDARPRGSTVELKGSSPVGGWGKHGQATKPRAMMAVWGRPARCEMGENGVRGTDRMLARAL